MNITQRAKWQQLYELLIQAKENSVELMVNEYDLVYITVTKVSKEVGGCGQCHARYDIFDLEGKIHSKKEGNNDNIPVEYLGGMSQFAMHTCNAEEDPENDFSPMLKVDLSKKHYHIYLNLDSLVGQMKTSPIAT